MRRAELEHVLRAASRIIHQRDFLVVGSAAILASFDDDVLPVVATRSDEADLAPYNDPDGLKSMELEGSLGQGSMFHGTFGYYADGVDFTTAIAPDGWAAPAEVGNACNFARHVCASSASSRSWGSRHRQSGGA